MNVGVLLAAGASRRMGRTKALIARGGQTWFARGVRHLWGACDTVVVVLGAHAREVRAAAEQEFVRLVERGRLHDDLQAAHRHGAAGLEVRFVVNAGWRSGMWSSVRLGLRSALRLSPGAVLVLPVDHPAVRPATIRSLAATLQEAVDSYREGAPRGARFPYAVVPRYRRRRGHPVALSPDLARAAAADRGAHDLSDAVRRNARLVGYLDCADAGVVRNHNRAED
jgi:CTP:molybdopterin cytidylyltransferase MocA